MNKVLTGIGEPLSGRLFLFDALYFEHRSVNIRRRDDNPLNGIAPTITRLIDYELFCGLKTQERTVREITVRELLDWQERGEKFQLIDVREPHEYEMTNLGADLIPLASVADR